MKLIFLLLLSLSSLSEEISSAPANSLLPVSRPFSYVTRNSWGAAPMNRSDDFDCYNYSNLGENFRNLREAYSNGRITVHHTAETYSVAETQQNYLAMGWTDIPYHFIIAANGNVYEGRPLNMMGGHAGYVDNETCENGLTTVELSKDYDFKNIGIALSGLWLDRCEFDGSTDDCVDSELQDAYDGEMPFVEYSENHPQTSALIALIRNLTTRFSIKQINTHRNIRIGGATLCPGAQVISHLRNALSANESLTFNYNLQTNPPVNNIVTRPVSCTYRVQSCE